VEPWRLIVTGGIGAGKSEVARLLSEAGITVVSADAIGHLVLEDEALAAIQARWPEVVSDGKVDRPGLASIVFEQPAELAALERMVHPAVARRIARAVEEAGTRPLALELSVPKVMEVSGWTMLVVDAEPTKRRQRLRDRGMPDADIERRMAVQPSRSDWLALADYVLDNSGDLTMLKEHVIRLLKQLGTSNSLAGVQ